MLFLYNAPIIVIAKMNKFTRGMALAKSLRLQRECLRDAQRALHIGSLASSQAALEKWKKERQAYKLALGWQSL